MNYFDLFGLPVHPLVDKQVLARTYVQLQKHVHPDYFAQGDAEEQETMLHRSSEVNRGFKILGSKETAIKYLLQLKGVLEEEEKFALPPDFLMEVMELNEMKMDGAEPEAIISRAAAMQAAEDEMLAPLLEAYDDAKAGPEVWGTMKAWYYKKKYLDRLMAE